MCPRPVKRRPPHLIAAGFVAAFAASVFTLIYTGLMVGPPTREEAGPPEVEGGRAGAPGYPEGAAAGGRDETDGEAAREGESEPQRESARARD